MLEKKVVNVPSNKTYTSPEEIAALGKFLRKVKEKLENFVTLLEDNLALPENDIRSGEIEKLLDHQELIENQVSNIDDLNKLIIELSLKDKKLKLETEKLSLDVQNLIELSDDVSILRKPSEVSLNEKKEKLKNVELVDLNEKKEILSNVEDISLKSDFEKLRDNLEVSLEKGSSKIEDNLEVSLEDSSSKIEDSLEITLEDSSSKIEDNLEVSLDENSEKLKDTTENLLKPDLSKLKNIPENQLKDDLSKLSGVTETLLNKKLEYILGLDVDLDKDSIKLEKNLDVDLDKDKELVGSPAQDGDITSFLKNYSGYSAGMKYLINLSLLAGNKIELTEDERKTLDEIKKYIGLDEREDKTAAKYQITIDSLKRMGTWGEKFAAYLTAILNRNKHFSSIIPYSDIDLLWTAITSWNGQETGLKVKYGEVLDGLLKEGAHFVNVPKTAGGHYDENYIYNTSLGLPVSNKTDKTTTGGKKFYDIADTSPGNDYGLDSKTDLDFFQKSKISKRPEDAQSGDITFTSGYNRKFDDNGVEPWTESSNEAFSTGLGKALRIPESLLPDITWNSGVKAGTFLRYAVELTIGKIHDPNIAGVTKQLLIDLALAALIISRRKLESLKKLEKHRLPGTVPGSHNKEISSLVDLARQGINEKSIIGYLLSFGLDNLQINVPFLDIDGKIYDPVKWRSGESGLFGETAWKRKNGLMDTIEGTDQNYSFKHYTYSDINSSIIAGGLKVTLLDLSNILLDSSVLSNYNTFLDRLKTSSKISTANLFTSSNNKYKVMTLDSNHVWEVTLEPYLGAENGYISFLPAYREINLINETTHGFKTLWEDWIPFTSYELNTKKLVSKTVALTDGEISYPTGMEFTNELRLTIADDQYKSWKMYFEEVIKCMAYLSRPHSNKLSFLWERDYTQVLRPEDALGGYSEIFKTYDLCSIALDNKVSELKNMGYNITEMFIEELSEVYKTGATKLYTEEGYSTIYENYFSCEIAMKLHVNSLTLAGYKIVDSHIEPTVGGYVYCVTYVTAESEELNINSGYRFYLRGDKYDTLIRTPENLNFYSDKSTDHSAVLEGIVNPAPYKNVAFRCKIYCMTPQFSTIIKYDLLVVLKDFQEEFLGEIDSGPTDLSLSFSIVGENPVGTLPMDVTTSEKDPSGKKKQTSVTPKSGISSLKETKMLITQ